MATWTLQQSTDAKAKHQFVLVTPIDLPRVEIIDAHRLWLINPGILFQTGYRIAGTREDIAASIRANGYSDQDIEQIFASSIDLTNYNNQMSDIYRQEVNDYNTWKRSVIKSNFDAPGIKFFDVMAALNPALIQKARTTGTTKGTKGTGTTRGKGKGIKSIIDKITSLKPGKVLDVSTLQPDGSGTKSINPPTRSRKFGGPNLPIVSADFDHYMLAISMLPGGQETYAADIDYVRQLFTLNPTTRGAILPITTQPTIPQPIQTNQPIIPQTTEPVLPTQPGIYQGIPAQQDEMITPTPVYPIFTKGQRQKKKEQTALLQVPTLQQNIVPNVPIPGQQIAPFPNVPIPRQQIAPFPNVPIPGQQIAPFPNVPIPRQQISPFPNVPIPGQQNIIPNVPIPGQQIAPFPNVLNQNPVEYFDDESDEEFDDMGPGELYGMGQDEFYEDEDEDEEFRTAPGQQNINQQFGPAVAQLFGQLPNIQPVAVGEQPTPFPGVFTGELEAESDDEFNNEEFDETDENVEPLIIPTEQTIPVLPITGAVTNVQRSPNVPLLPMLTVPNVQRSPTIPAIPLPQTTPTIPLPQTTPTIPLPQTTPTIPLPQIAPRSPNIPTLPQFSPRIPTTPQIAPRSPTVPTIPLPQIAPRSPNIPTIPLPQNTPRSPNIPTVIIPQL